MGDSDAEWVGVDFEFGTPRPVPRPITTPRPLTERPPPRKPPAGFPHEEPEIERPSSNPTTSGNMVTLISSVAGGLIVVVLLLLVVYMFILRRRLNRAKVASTDAQYQLRVEDVAHISNLDETSNTYVNTTDLQKLLTSVRAKKKSEERPPTMPKIQHQTPAPYQPPIFTTNNTSNNNGYVSDPDVVVVKAPMPLPHTSDICNTESEWNSKIYPNSETIYANVEPVEPFKLAMPPLRKKNGAPTGAPPPPPSKQNTSCSDNTNVNDLPSPVVARPAPPPPVSAKSKSAESLKTQNVKPSPPVLPKPNKNETNNIGNPKPDGKPSVLKPAIPQTNKPSQPSTNKPTPPATINKPIPPNTQKPLVPSANKPNSTAVSHVVPQTTTKPSPAIKPAPRVPSKPSIALKGKGLPPLKMALLPSLSKASIDSCGTPDTGIIELTPDNTPTPDTSEDKVTASVSSKIAFLEGKMPKITAVPNRAKT